MFFQSKAVSAMPYEQRINLNKCEVRSVRHVLSNLTAFSHFCRKFLSFSDQPITMYNHACMVTPLLHVLALT